MLRPTVTTRSPPRPRPLFKDHFGADAEVFFAFNGTGANVVGLQSLLRPFEAVICAPTAHIYVDECGAPERFLGSKLIPVATPDGKLTPELVEAAAGGVGDEHHVQPRVVSITQATEVGTCYRVEEIAALAAWAHDHAHVAPPRRCPALQRGRLPRGRPRRLRVRVPASTCCPSGAPRTVPWGPRRSSRSDRRKDPSLRYIRKQSMQLASKMRFVAAQFNALLSDDLWRTNAEHANAMAQTPRRQGLPGWTGSRSPIRSRPTASSPCCPRP